MAQVYIFILLLEYLCTIYRKKKGSETVRQTKKQRYENTQSSEVKGSGRKETLCQRGKDAVETKNEKRRSYRKTDSKE